MDEVVATCRIEDGRAVIRYDRRFWSRQKDPLGKQVDLCARWQKQNGAQGPEGLVLDVGELK